MYGVVLLYNLCRECLAAGLCLHNVHSCTILCERYAVLAGLQADACHCLAAGVVYSQRAVFRHVHVQHVSYRIRIYVEADFS